MSVETFANNSSTTLASLITDGTDTSISVTAHTSFPQSGQFRIRIENELLLVTAGAGTTTWTVTRGVESTSAVGHASGTAIIHPVTAAALAKFRADTVVNDAIGSRPSAGVAGRLFIPTGGLLLQRDNGSTWDSYGPIYKMTQPPTLSNFTWANQGTATASDLDGSILLTVLQASGTNLRILKKAAPGSTPYTITAAFTMLGRRTGGTDARMIMGFRQSSDGKLAGLYKVLNVENALPVINAINYTTETATTGSPLFAVALQSPMCVFPITWFRLSDDGTNRKMWLSNDGVTWLELYSVTRTTHLTANEIFWGAECNGTTGNSLLVKLLSWEEVS